MEVVVVNVAKSTHREPLDSNEAFLRRYPRICAHIIAESLGYATPNCAASILRDAHEGKENSCEWIFSRYNRDPKPAVKRAISARHRHKGYMASYEQALQIVRQQLDTGRGPDFASWF